MPLHLYSCLSSATADARGKQRSDLPYAQFLLKVQVVPVVLVDPEKERHKALFITAVLIGEGPSLPWLVK